MTGYLAVACDNERDLQMAVARQNLQINNQLPEVTGTCEKYFWMAFNKYPIKDPDEVKQFDNSWIGAGL